MGVGVGVVWFVWRALYLGMRLWEGASGWQKSKWEEGWSVWSPRACARRRPKAIFPKFAIQILIPVFSILRSIFDISRPSRCQII